MIQRINGCFIAIQPLVRSQVSTITRVLQPLGYPNYRGVEREFLEIRREIADGQMHFRMGPALDHIERTLRAVTGAILNEIDPGEIDGDDIELLNLEMGFLEPSDDVVADVESRLHVAPTLGEHLRVYEAQRQRDMEEQRGLGLRFFR